MTATSRKNRAGFETTSRLLAQVVNEGLAAATVKTSGNMHQEYLILTRHQESFENPERWVKVGLLPDTHYELRDGQVISLVRPGNMKPLISRNAFYGNRSAGTGGNLRAHASLALECGR
jgi:hypothetical protein